MRYILKHKDIDVLEFDISPINASVSTFKFEDQLRDHYRIQDIRILNNTFIPASIKSKFDLKNLQSSANSLFLLNWLDNRQIPKERAHSRELRKMYNFDVLKFLNMSLGLSFMDVNWVIEKDRYEQNKSEFSYDKINLYDNPEYSEKEMQLSLFGTYDENFSFLTEYDKAKFEQAQRRLQNVDSTDEKFYEHTKSREKKI